MTAVALTRTPTPDASDVSGGQTIHYNPAEAELRHYSPEEVWELKLLPIKPSTLRKMAQKHEIDCSRAGGRISFLLKHLRAHATEQEQPVMKLPCRAA